MVVKFFHYLATIDTWLPSISKMKTIYYEDNKIEVSEQSWTGKEFVRYNGEIVSQKRTLTGGTHMFRVKEKGQMVSYEVEISMGLMTAKSTVRRDGVIIFSDR